MARYIDAEEAIKVILSCKVYDNSLVECPEECNSFLSWAANKVSNMPTADVVEVKHGKWVAPAAVNVYRCSVCEEYTTLEVPGLFYQYCPNCGAKMKGEDDADKNQV